MKKNFNTGIVKETYDIQSLLFEQYVSGNYSLSQTISSVNKTKFNEYLESKGNLVKNYSFQINLTAFVEYIEIDSNEKHGKALILSNVVTNKNKIILDLFAEDLKTVHMIYDEIFNACVKDELMSENVHINFHKFTLDNRGGLKVAQEKIKKNNFLTIIPDYYPSIDIDIFMKEFFIRQENLLILNGESGTGKTKFSSLILKYVSDNYHLIEDEIDSDDDIDEEDIDFTDDLYKVKEVKVAYVKNEDILHTEDFWITLSSQNYNFIILDDLDYMLLPRQREVTSQIEINKAKFISQLLSFTDGVIPTKTKFIITSNKMDSDIDPALMRSGRLFDILNFKSLTSDQALDIWLKNGLNEEDFNFENEEILASELGSLIKMKLKDSTVSLRGYLKDPSVSSTHKAIKKSKSRMGFN